MVIFSTLEKMFYSEEIVDRIDIGTKPFPTLLKMLFKDVK